MRLILLLPEKDKMVHVRCDGPLSLAGSGADTDPLQELLGPHCFDLNVLLNLEHAQGIDTSGLVWLMRAHKNFARRTGKLVLYSVPPLVSALLDTLRLTNELDIAAGETGARELARDGERTRPGRPPERPVDEEVAPLRLPG
jgi:anti-anti-sigma regulatory factor